MGKRGPAPKPSEQKRLEGTYRPDRAARNEPQPKVLIPSCPVWLSPQARMEYRRVARLLMSLRVLTEADRAALVAYAHQYAKWVEAEQVVQRQGPVLVSDKGGMYLNPWQGVANMAFKNMAKMMAEFGMTPASRTRVEAQPADDAPKSLAEKLFASVTIGD